MVLASLVNFSRISIGWMMIADSSFTALTGPAPNATLRPSFQAGSEFVLPTGVIVMPCDGQLQDEALLEAIVELNQYYQGFSWESQVWALDGSRRSPYRVLILFGLSSRTRDPLLVVTCRRFFESFPEPQALINAWPIRSEDPPNLVRKGHLPFVNSVVLALREGRGMVPKDRDCLRMITGVGDKVAECVMAYGWGEEALPMDGNGCRVIERLGGLTFDRPSRRVTYVRSRIKAIFNSHRDWMAALGVAMIDLHELFRLHGQVLCTQKPGCSQCPVSRCRSRRQEYSGYVNPGVSGAVWQEWRELLLDPK